MFAELIDGTADGTLCLIIALILIVVICVWRVVLKAFDPALVAAVWFFLVLWLLVVT